mgnify:FL=1
MVTEQAAVTTILVIDDDAEIVKLITRQLTNEGYAVIGVTTLSNAINLVDGEDPFDLLLTDYQLCADWTGVDLIKHAKQRRPNLPTILISGGEPDNIYDQEFWDSTLFLRKPLKRRVVVGAVLQQLSKTCAAD